MKIKLFLLFFFIVSTITLAAVLAPQKKVQADNYCKKENMCSDSDCLEKLVDECQTQIDKANTKAASLASEIEFADNQINLTELKIQSTNRRIAEKEASIEKLSGDIENITVRMDGLTKSIAFQGNVLNERMRARYKSIESSPIIIILGADSLNKLVQKTEYLKVMELQDHKLIAQMNKTKDDYAQQKQLYEETKSKEEDLQAQIIVEKNNLVGYQNDLANQRAQKQTLLEDTQNDEAKYQSLLEEAQKQLAEFRGFTSSAGGGAISANGFGKGKEGWYYSQRDSRWAYHTIGYSNDTILSVGCLVTSVAMVFKSHGKDVDPADIADRNYYFAKTAYMIIPSDFDSYWGSYSTLKSRIDDSLSNDEPVIVGLRTGLYGTHFVVLSDKKDGSYIMYDPWYGPDLKFTSHYNTGEIYEAVFY